MFCPSNPELFALSLAPPLPPSPIVIGYTVPSVTANLPVNTIPAPPPPPPALSYPFPPPPPPPITKYSRLLTPAGTVQLDVPTVVKD